MLTFSFTPHFYAESRVKSKSIDIQDNENAPNTTNSDQSSVKIEVKEEDDIKNPLGTSESLQLSITSKSDASMDIISDEGIKQPNEPEVEVKMEECSSSHLPVAENTILSASVEETHVLTDSLPLQSLSSQESLVLVDSQPSIGESIDASKNRPITRQMARSSGEEVWPWSNSLPGMVGLYDDDTFVVEEVEMVEKSKKRTFDGLEPPRSLNYLDPTRDEAKKARKSALEQLKQSRAARVPRTPDTIVTNDAAPQLPIFDTSDDEEDIRALQKQSRTPNTRNPSSRPTPKPSNHTESLEVRKRKRDFETPIGDYLPSFGPDFIVDDGSGYTVDPLYRTPHPECYIAPRPSIRSSTSPVRLTTFSSTPKSSSSLQSIDPTAMDVDDHLITSNHPHNPVMANTASNSRVNTSTTSHTSVITPNDDIFARSDDNAATATVLSERSNPASLGGGTTSTRTAGPYISTDTSIPPKLRLTVLIREERFFISCPEESTFSWLQATATTKYRAVSRMEVDLDHLETNFGARLMPEDKIREYMNDLETVVAIIKESRPLDLVALYKADCASLAIPENSTILKRFSEMDRSETLPGGVHELLPLQGLSLDSASLASLYGVLNLHSFVTVDVSSNHLTPSAMVALLQEISKSTGLGSPSNFRTISLADNLLGLSIDVDSPLKSLIGRFTSLTSLNLSDNCLNDRAVSSLIPSILQQAINLTSLDLSSNFFGISAVHAIENGPAKFGNLTRLNLARNPLREEGFSCLIRALGSNSSLHTLDLSYCNIFTTTSNEAWSTANGGNLPTIEATIEALGSKLSALSNLSLRGCKIDTWSYPMLLPSVCMSLKRLHVLDLADCDIVAHDLRFLKTVLQSPSLVQLNLSFNFLASERSLVLDFALSAPKQQKIALILQECGLKAEKAGILAAVSSRPSLSIDVLGN